MGTRGYLRIARAHWVLMLVTVVVGLGVGGLVTVVQPRTYASDFTILLTPPASSDPSVAYQGSLLAAEKAKSYAQLLPSEQLAADVVDRLNLPTTPAELASRISSSLSPETVLISARVTDSTPEGAQTVARAVGEEYSALIAGLERPADLDQRPALEARVVQAPSLSTEPISPQPAVGLALGGLVGLVLSFGAVIAWERVRRPVRSPDEVEDIAFVLGSVPAEPRGTSPLIASGPGRGVGAESYRRLRARLVPGPAGRRPGWVIAVMSPSHGDGRTTVTANLATALARTGRQVTVVDADLVGRRLGRAVGADEHPAGLAELVEGGARADLEQALRRTTESTLRLLGPGSEAASERAEILASGPFRALVADLAATSDLVLIDTAPLADGADALDVAPLCDGVVLVARYGRTRRPDLVSAAETLEAVGGRLLGLVLNGVPAAVAAADRRRPGTLVRPTETGADDEADADAEGTTVETTAELPPVDRPGAAREELSKP